MCLPHPTIPCKYCQHQFSKCPYDSTDLHSATGRKEDIQTTASAPTALPACPAVCGVASQTSSQQRETIRPRLSDLSCTRQSLSRRLETRAVRAAATVHVRTQEAVHVLAVHGTGPAPASPREPRPSQESLAPRGPRNRPGSPDSPGWDAAAGLLRRQVFALYVLV